MGYMNEIFEKVSIRGVADYLLFGLTPDKECRDYEERIEKISLEYEEVVARYDREASSDLLDVANAMTSEIASVYMEIGIQAGILLIKDMFQNLGEMSQGEQEQTDYKAMYLVLSEAVAHALKLVEASNDKRAGEAWRILKNGQCRSEAIHIRMKRQD